MEGDKNFISLTEAARCTPYSAEYLSLLARKGRLPAKKIGRNWYTTKVAVADYIEQQKQILLEELEKRNTSAQLQASTNNTVLYNQRFYSLEELGIAGGPLSAMPLFTTRRLRSFFPRFAQSFVIFAAVGILFFSVGVFVINYHTTGSFDSALSKSRQDLSNLAAVGKELWDLLY